MCWYGADGGGCGGLLFLFTPAVCPTYPTSCGKICGKVVLPAKYLSTDREWVGDVKNWTLGLGWAGHVQIGKADEDSGPKRKKTAPFCSVFICYDVYKTRLCLCL